MIKLKDLLTEEYDYFDDSRALIIKNLDRLKVSVKKSKGRTPDNKYAISKLHAFYAKVVALKNEWDKLSKEGF